MSINQRIGFIFLFIVLVFNVARAQTAIPTVNLTNFKWGLKDSATNAVIVEAKYDYIMDFYNGVAITRLNNKYGLINAGGKEIALPLYERCFWVNDTLLLVQQNGLYGLVNAFGEIQMPLVFHSLVVFGNYLVVNNGHKSGIIDLKGNIIIPFQYDEILTEQHEVGGFFLDSVHIRVSNNGRQGVIDFENKPIVSPHFEQVFLWPNHQIHTLHNKASTLLAKNGDTLIKAGLYQLTHPPTEGLLVAGKNGMFGFIDSAQQVVVPFQYQNAWSFSNGLATVQKDSLWGAINKKNEIIIPFEYAQPIHFYRGVALVEKRQNSVTKLAYMRVDGTFLTDFIFDEGAVFDKGYAQVKIGDKWGVLDEKGKAIVPVKYDKIAIRYGYVVVSNAEIYGLYDLNGSLVIPEIYSFIYPSRNDAYIMVRKERNYGFVNQRGEVVIPILFENARNFSQGRATVLKNGQSFEIDRNGEQIGL